MTEPLRIVAGADAAGLALKDLLVRELRDDPRVASVQDLGVTDAADDTPYPHVGLAGAKLVAAGEADRALLICGTGIGMAITANKVPGVRATVAHDAYSLERSVLSNNCQVLALGGRVIGPEIARYLVREWIGLRFDEKSPSAGKVSVISAYESDR